MDRVEIGIIGCGNISGAYLKACRFFEILHVSAVADLDVARAQAKAAEFDVPRALSVDELLADPDIEIVINLTIPSAHAQVSRRILEAGKSVYSEKPLAIDREDGRAFLALAERRGLRVGCAPDTFLGGGLQTCRGLIDSGAIGRPLAATCFMLSHGPESWHPDPAFFYEQGAGPLFDMGPYYLTALVSLLGPMTTVAGSAVVSMPERAITSQPLAGTVIEPKTPTHVTGLIDFTSGAVGTLTTSFDVWASEHPKFEIYGTEGTLSVPDPNTFGGPVRLKLGGEQAWREIDLTHGYTQNSRGLGVADMAHAVRAGEPHRASGELAFHVLDAMQSMLEAAAAKRTVSLSSTCDRSMALPADRGDGALERAWSREAASHA
jgi:predicted dehydrogenase